MLKSSGAIVSPIQISLSTRVHESESVPVYAVKEKREHNQGEDQEVKLANKLLFNLLLSLTEFVGYIVLLVNIITSGLGFGRVARHYSYQDKLNPYSCVLIGKCFNKLISIPVFDK